jgi:hypothetical protein
MIPVTAIFFSCKRLHLLRRVIDAFERINTYPVCEMIIVNDSGDEEIHNKLRSFYPDYTLILHPKNVGLIKSIDIGYSHIKTDYFFHCEDDWMVTRPGFLEQSLAIMEDRKDIEEVWLCEFPNHPCESEIYEIEGIKYRLASHLNNHAGDWHGFTTAIGLKRISDYKKVAPYSDIPYEGTIWHREGAIGHEYHKLGYRTAVLTERYAENIGYGQSEYITGLEK